MQLTEDIPDITDGCVVPFVRTARAEPDRVFLSFEGVPYTFAWMDRASDAFAFWMRARGIGKGDRVAVMMRNSPIAAAIVFGCAKASVTWVPVNPQQRGAGLSYVLQHSQPTALLIDDELLGVVGTIDVPGNILIVGTGALAEEALERVDDLDAITFAESPPYPEDTFALLYTSGTTGPPKSVIVTHAMVRIAAEAAIRVSRAEDGSVLFLWEPLYHVGGAQLLMLPVLRDLTLAMVGRFSASRFWQQARDARATHIHYLGGILQMLLAQAPSDLDRTHGVRVAWGGGCSAATFAGVKERFGVEVYECYGMTETSSIASVADGTEGGVIGRELPWLDITIRDTQDTVLPTGERGEITIATRLPGAIFTGYYRNPEATKTALRGGLLRTGDLGSMDERGVLTFHGRLTDSLRCRGENVSAWEIEHVVNEHPLVAEAAVIGVDAEIGEQDIKLFVKQTEGAGLAPAELIEWLQPRLARYQLPRYIEFVHDFEHTPSQRVKKSLLRASTQDSWDRETQPAGIAKIV